MYGNGSNIKIKMNCMDNVLLRMLRVFLSSEELAYQTHSCGPYSAGAGNAVSTARPEKEKGDLRVALLELTDRVTRCRKVTIYKPVESKRSRFLDRGSQ